jgi:hypothetical protein
MVIINKDLIYTKYNDLNYIIEGGDIVSIECLESETIILIDDVEYSVLHSFAQWSVVLEFNNFLNYLLNK